MHRCKVWKIDSDSRAKDSRDVLFEPDRMPAYWPNLFATMQHYEAGRSGSTAYAYLTAIASAMDWMRASTDEDLSERILDGPPLDGFEASRIGYFFRLSRKQQNRELAIELSKFEHSESGKSVTRLHNHSSG